MEKDSDDFEQQQYISLSQSYIRLHKEYQKVTQEIYTLEQQNQQIEMIKMKSDTIYQSIEKQYADTTTKINQLQAELQMLEDQKKLNSDSNQKMKLYAKISDLKQKIDSFQQQLDIKTEHIDQIKQKIELNKNKCEDIQLEVNRIQDQQIAYDEQYENLLQNLNLLAKKSAELQLTLSNQEKQREEYESIKNIVENDQFVQIYQEKLQNCSHQILKTNFVYQSTFFEEFCYSKFKFGFKLLLLEKLRQMYHFSNCQIERLEKLNLKEFQIFATQQITVQEMPMHQSINYILIYHFFRWIVLETIILFPKYIYSLSGEKLLTLEFNDINVSLKAVYTLYCELSGCKEPIFNEIHQNYEFFFILLEFIAKVTNILAFCQNDVKLLIVQQLLYELLSKNSIFVLQRRQKQVLKQYFIKNISKQLQISKTGWEFSQNFCKKAVLQNMFGIVDILSNEIFSELLLQSDDIERIYIEDLFNQNYRLKAEQNLFLQVRNELLNVQLPNKNELLKQLQHVNQDIETIQVEIDYLKQQIAKNVDVEDSIHIQSEISTLMTQKDEEEEEIDQNTLEQFMTQIEKELKHKHQPYKNRIINCINITQPENTTPNVPKYHAKAIYMPESKEQIIETVLKLL